MTVDFPVCCETDSSGIDMPSNDSKSVRGPSHGAMLWCTPSCNAQDKISRFKAIIP